MGAHGEIDALLSELLGAGVSPKYVSRLASELEDHFADLEAEARRFGVPDGEASDDARARLGASAAIACEFAKRPELKSFLYRSRCANLLLRAFLAACAGAAAPVRGVASVQGVMLRYTAATAAGTGVTVTMLLIMTLLLSPAWGDRVVDGILPAGEHVGAPLTGPAVDSKVAEPERDRASGGSAKPSAGAPDAEASAVPRPAAEPAERRAEPARPERLRRGAMALPDVEPFWTNRPIAAGAFRVAPTVPRPFVTMLRPVLDRHALRPIVEVPPTYPYAAARRGIEGYVVVEYTVAGDGGVREAVVVESSSPLFHRAALEAVTGLRYRPRAIGGEPVDVVGVRTLIRFDLEA